MGTLYIVSTPIGNLKDITLRALEVLKDVNYILCEDTRVSGKLLNNFDVSNKMISFNDYNEQSRIPMVIGDLTADKNIALVSDAGTPLISDPGFKLVREAIQRGVKIEPIPGPSAAIAALTISGLPPDKFFFVGYLPKKNGKRNEMLKNILQVKNLISSTIIIYESPYRLLTTLGEIQVIFGNVDIAVCRELTKLHEEIRREKVSESIKYFSSYKPRGELSIVF